MVHSCPSSCRHVQWAAPVFGLFAIASGSDDVGVAVHSGGKAGSTVQALTSKDFDKHVKEGLESPWLVKFYAPWCSHCKALEPAWKQLAKKLQGRVRLAKVDCIAESWLSDQYDVESFPTIKLIADRHQYTFAGPRKLEAFELFATNGWKMMQGETLPKDKPWQERALKVVMTYSLHISAVMIVCLFVWMCCTGQPTEEQRAKRKAFEERLAAMEKLAAEKAQQRKLAEAAKLKGETQPAQEATTNKGGEASQVLMEGEDPKAGIEVDAYAEAPKTAAEKKDD